VNNIKTEFAKRRLFLSNGDNFYHVLSFTQSRSDGSIYVSSPDFLNSKFLIFKENEGKIEFFLTDSPGEGKLSIHGSGMAKITPNVHNLVIHGNFLQDKTTNTLGVRHLFTIQLAEPKFSPSSPALHRKSDFIITSKSFKPSIFIFFAIPRIKDLSTSFQVHFDIDDLESVPPEGGGGLFELLYHNVFWFAYRTKYMEVWPENSFISYHDGYLVPVIIGIGDKKFKAELRIPDYKLEESKLIIIM